MKSKYIILASASALLISGVAFAQKDQIKDAQKALKKGDSELAISILDAVAPMIVEAKDAEKAQYYFVKGNAYLEMAKKEGVENKNLLLAADAYKTLIDTEKASGKMKYSTQAVASTTEIKGKLINGAVADSKNNKHVDAAKKIYDAYLLDKKDTINLYYAASAYVNATDYAAALPLYEELKRLNYSGKGTAYLATNKATGEENAFPTEKERDLAVKIGTYEKPRTEISPSKRGEIYKNISLILVQDGKTEEAKKAIAEARAANPGDSSLLLTEANLYLETKDFDTYKKLINEMLKNNPNDADLIFNLGVLSANAKDMAEAEKFYKRVIEIKPDYVNAYINLAALKLDDEKAMIDEMNKLGTSAKDMKRYEELKTKRENLFKSTIPYLKKAVELDPKNEDVYKTLLNVYSALEMTTEYKVLKASKAK